MIHKNIYYSSSGSAVPGFVLDPVERSGVRMESVLRKLKIKWGKQQMSKLTESGRVY